MTKLNPDIDSILSASSYDEATKELVRGVLNIELNYATRSNYRAESEITQLLEVSEGEKEND